MDITPLLPKGQKAITGYGNGAFKINDERTEGSIIITPDAVWPRAVRDAAGITATSLQPLLDKTNYELLIIGCGKEHVILTDIIRSIRKKNINAEVMATGAACRTYNVLLTEGRQVAAALIAV